MKRDLSEFIRVSVGGIDYMVLRDTRGEGQLIQGNFEGVLTTLQLFRTDNREEPVGYLSFLMGMRSALQTPTPGVYGSSQFLHHSLANLLPYLPGPDLEGIVEKFKQAYKPIYFVFTFGDRMGYTDSQRYRFVIPFDTSLFKTSRKLVFPEGTSDEDIRKAIVNVLSNHRKIHPTTYMPKQELFASLPIPEDDYRDLILLMREEGVVDVLPEHGDVNQIVTVRIKYQGVQSSQMAIHNYGNMAVGNSGSVSQTINTNTVFSGVRQELERRNELNSAVVSDSIRELETEISKPGKEIVGIQKAFQKLKGLAEWAAEMVGKAVLQEMARRTGIPI